MADMRYIIIVHTTLESLQHFPPVRTQNNEWVDPAITNLVLTIHRKLFSWQCEPKHHHLHVQCLDEIVR